MPLKTSSALILFKTSSICKMCLHLHPPGEHVSLCKKNICTPPGHLLLTCTHTQLSHLVNRHIAHECIPLLCDVNPTRGQNGEHRWCASRTLDNLCTVAIDGAE